MAGSVDYFLRCAKAPDDLRKDLNAIIRPFIPQYGRMMKAEKIKADQAAVALITDLIAEISLENLLKMRDDRDPRLRGFKALFLLCEALAQSQPDLYERFFRVPPEKTFYVLTTAN
ncbi:hypothetical protein ACWPMX_05580 [Tsuneonella sp. HG094]